MGASPGGWAQLMGLDATIYCDCFETGKLCEPPPPGCDPYVCEDGSLECRNDEMAMKLAFDQWLHFRACKHERGILLSQHLGNVALVGALRQELSAQAERFPLLLGKVLYWGTHCGDFVGAAYLKALGDEVHLLAERICTDLSMVPYVDQFRGQMDELINSAAAVGKPISF